MNAGQDSKLVKRPHLAFEFSSRLLVIYQIAFGFFCWSFLSDVWHADGILLDDALCYGRVPSVFTSWCFCITCGSSWLHLVLSVYGYVFNTCCLWSVISFRLYPVLWIRKQRWIGCGCSLNFFSEILLRDNYWERIRRKTLLQGTGSSSYKHMKR